MFLFNFQTQKHISYKISYKNSSHVFRLHFQDKPVDLSSNFQFISPVEHFTFKTDTAKG